MDAGGKGGKEATCGSVFSTVLRRRSAAMAKPKAARQRAITRMCTSMELLPPCPIADTLPRLPLFSWARVVALALVCAVWDGERKG